MERLGARSVEFGEYRVHATRVVADHSPERASAVGRGIRPVDQTVDGGGLLQVVEHTSWLDARYSPRGIDFDDSIEVPARVEHQGDVAALTGQARAAAP